MKIFYETCVTNKIIERQNFICLDFVDIPEIQKYKDSPIIAFVSHQTRKKLENDGFVFMVNDYPDQFTSQYLLSYFNKFTLTGDMILVPFGSILNGLTTENFFLRPNSGNKLFTGQVVNVNEFNIFKNTFNIPDDCLCARSSTIDILSEKRSFVDTRNKTIITQSLYSFSDKTDVDFNIENNVKEILDSFYVDMLPDIIVMDFALLKDDTIKLVEFNSVITSGHYNCDIDKIIEAISFITN